MSHNAPEQNAQSRNNDSSNDALERLKKRQRPTVSARDASLTPGATDPSTIGQPDISVSKVADNQISKQTDMSIHEYTDSSTSRQSDIDMSTITDIQTSRYLDNQKASQQQVEQLKTKQSTLRLEAELLERLSEVCSDNNISREVFIEALFMHYETDPEAKAAILAEAKRRASHRMLQANLKRARSMMQRFQ
jgi:hypothetical protein